MSDVGRILTKAKAAGIRLNAPAAQSDVDAFERLHGVSLPEEYREFLLRVGNGGSGPPSYGLLSLGVLPRDYDSPFPDLSQPFPFTKTWVWEGGDESKEGPIEAAYRGAVVLGSDGCGQYWVLITSGPERGKVWMRTDVGIQPLEPTMTLLEWYEAWLDGRRNWWD